MFRISEIMLRKLAILILVVTKVLMFQQNDYDMKFERAELVSYDKNYIEKGSIITFKYNRTQPACNISFTIIKDLGNYTQVIVQGYTFLSNEYRLFPLHYSFNLCDAIKNNDYGFGNLIKHGNFTCPKNKGIYYAKNWIPDGSRFPPNIPNGAYMVELNATYNSKEFAIVRGYATVSRPLGRRH